MPYAHDIEDGPAAATICADPFDITWLDRSVLADRDGPNLTIYRAGHGRKQAILALPPVGVPARAIAPFLARLAIDFDLITFESRGYPSPASAFEPEDAALEHLVADIGRVADHVGLTVPPSLAGFCTGGTLALLAADRWPGRFSRVAAISPRIKLGDRLTLTQGARAGADVFPKLARSREAARKIGPLMGAMLKGSASGLYDDIADGEAFSRLVNGVYDDAEALFRYACMQTELYRADFSSILPCLDIPVHLVGARDDTIIPWQWLVAAASENQKITVDLIEAGGHWALITHPEIAETVTRYARIQADHNL